MSRSPARGVALATLLLLVFAAAGIVDAGGGSGAGSSPTNHSLTGKSGPAPQGAEATIGGLAGQVGQTQGQPGSDAEERRRRNLEIFRLGTEIARLATQF